MILTIGVTFIMDMRLKSVQFMKEKEKDLELFHQDPDRVVGRNEEPQPKSVPMPLAKQGARRNAMDTAMDMAEAISIRKLLNAQIQTISSAAFLWRISGVILRCHVNLWH